MSVHWRFQSYVAAAMRATVLLCAAYKPRAKAGFFWLVLSGLFASVLHAASLAIFRFKKLGPWPYRRRGRGRGADERRDENALNLIRK